MCVSHLLEDVPGPSYEYLSKKKAASDLAKGYDQTAISDRGAISNYGKVDSITS